jgi:ElaB/YqjD/DUF883 family membrane-anchored ribosome-binding protein
MPMVTDAKAIAETVKEQLGSSLHDVEDRIHQGRRAVLQARYALEDGVGSAALKVRRHPGLAVAASVGVGVLVGCAIGFACGRRLEKRA